MLTSATKLSRHCKCSVSPLTLCRPVVPVAKAKHAIQRQCAGPLVLLNVLWQQLAADAPPLPAAKAHTLSLCCKVQI